MAVSQKSKLILNIQDSLRFTVTADDSLGPGFAVRGNGKKRGEIAKKKKFSASEATISLFQTTARLASLAYFSLTPFPSLRSWVPGYVDADNVFLVLIRKDKMVSPIAQVKAKAALCLSYRKTQSVGPVEN